jgi:hypothetical protein
MAGIGKFGTVTLVGALVTGLAWVAWAGDGPEITVKQDEGVSFAHFKTFGVVEPGAPISEGAAPRGRGRDQSDDARRFDQGEEAIRRTILESLAQRGLEPNTDGDPDFYIGYDALVMRFDDPMTRPSELIRPSWGTTVAVQRSYSVFDSGAAYEGRLTIFVVDAESRQIIWSATAEGNVRSMRNIVNNTHQLVSEMMARLPEA